MRRAQSRPMVLVTFPGRQARRRLCRELLGEKCDLVFLADLAGEEKRDALARAELLIGGNLRVELGAEEGALLENLRFIQLIHAGIDHIPFSILPRGIPIACARGATARVMAEHILGLTLACSRRLLLEHAKMREGEFNQMVHRNRMLGGGTAAIIGMGGVGRAVAPLFGALGMRVIGINRTGTSQAKVDFMGTTADLETVLGAADVIVVCLALTRRTMGMIGAKELAWCKEKAILVNVSRGEVIEETPLYEHLLAHPDFYAGLDAWWVEPVRHGEFRMKHPFLDLPNLVASPHNSSEGDTGDPGFRATLENVGRCLDGQTPLNLVHDDEKLH